MTTSSSQKPQEDLDTKAAVELGWKSLLAGLTDVSSKHSGLFQSKANERAITHVIACCFDRYFYDLVKDLVEPQVPWNIDCEYNRILEKHTSKSQPYEFLLERLTEIEMKKKTAQNEKWQKYLSRIDDKFFDDRRKLLQFDSKGRARSLTANKNIVPDIILHQRTLNDPENNAIAIEVKPAWVDAAGTLFDLIKLSALTTTGASPTYQRGIFLHFDTKGGLVPGECWMFDLNDGDEPTAIS